MRVQKKLRCSFHNHKRKPIIEVQLCLMPNFLFRLAGQVFSQKLLSLRDQHKTSEGSPSDDDSYLGYSVATGEFNGDGDNADVVVGMPRGANLTGKVKQLLLT